MYRSNNIRQYMSYKIGNVYIGEDLFYAVVLARSDQKVCNAMPHKIPLAICHLESANKGCPLSPPFPRCKTSCGFRMRLSRRLGLWESLTPEEAARLVGDERLR
jgi:hypothetical protein